MTERTRRATEVVDMQADYMEQCRPGTAKAFLEGLILDPSQDPNDPRYGHGDFLYGEGRTFQDFARRMAGAMSFTATTDLFREMLLTMEMMDEEGLSFLPLHEHHLPAKSGFFLFPYGVRNPFHLDDGVHMERKRGGLFYVDEGGGTEHWVDGFMWEVIDRVSRDGHASKPVPGLSIILLTRYRGDESHRPFRMLDGRMPPPALVGSDLTAWAFDEEGQDSWIDPEFLAEQNTAYHPDAKAAMPSEELEAKRERLRVHLAENRWWVRSLVWSVLRWTTEEVWLDESGDRASSRRLGRARPVMHENPIEDGKVVIVDLRPERRETIEKSEAAGEPPWWRTRWRVRGHYARRRTAIRDEQGNTVGPVRGPESVEGVTFRYKRVYIEEHTRGPDNMPLVLRDPVGVVNR